MTIVKNENQRSLLFLVLIVAAIAAIIALVLVGFSLLFNGASDRRDAVHYGDDLRDGLAVYAVLDGVEITEAHWTFGVAETEQSLAFLALAAEEDDDISAIAAAQIELIERYGLETVVYAGLLMDAGFLADVDRRGFGPERGQVHAIVEAGRADIDQLRQQADAEGDADLLVLIDQFQARVASVGTDLYWGVLAPEDVHRDIGVEQLRATVMEQALDNDLAPQEAQRAWPNYSINLVRNADVDVRNGPIEGLSRDTAVQYLEEFSGLVF